MTTAIRPGLTRDVRPEELDAYWRDGAAIVRGIIPLEWIDALRAATEEVMADPAVPGLDFAATRTPEMPSTTRF